MGWNSKSYGKLVLLPLGQESEGLFPLLVVVQA